MEENLDVPFSIQTSVDSRILEWARETSHEFAKRISYYRCAMLDVENRFNVLNEEYLLDHGRPPVNSVKTRLKTIPSIQEKVKRKGISFSVAEVEKEIHDIAGVRVVCSFSEDVYAIADPGTAVGDRKHESRGLRTSVGFPKGALTHHPGGEVVFPVEIVRSSPR